MYMFLYYLSQTSAVRRHTSPPAKTIFPRLWENRALGLGVFSSSLDCSFISLSLGASLGFVCGFRGSNCTSRTHSRGVWSLLASIKRQNCARSIRQLGVGCSIRKLGGGLSRWESYLWLSWLFSMQRRSYKARGYWSEFYESTPDSFCCVFGDFL